VISIALPDDTSRDAEDDAALAAGLALLNVLPRTEAYPAQRVYVTPDHLALAHFVNAGAGAVAWVVRAEGDPAVEERWAGVLRAAMAGAAT
jgi:hypothetical protein